MTKKEFKVQRALGSLDTPTFEFSRTCWAKGSYITIKILNDLKYLNIENIDLHKLSIKIELKLRNMILELFEEELND